MKPWRCLVTAGPTREHLDPVRYLTNGSSGRMGYAVARAALRRGWTVDLVSGPVSLPPPAGAKVYPVISAQEMYERCAPLFPLCDLFVAVAAVADYRPRNFSPTKLKKNGLVAHLELEPTIDLLKTFAATKSAGQIVVGFAAETDHLEEHAGRKLREKKLDWIVANDLTEPGVGMNAENNHVIVFSAGGIRKEFGPAGKDDVAEFILNLVAPGAP